LEILGAATVLSFNTPPGLGFAAASWAYGCSGQKPLCTHVTEFNLAFSSLMSVYERCMRRNLLEKLN